jgi:hypothetical protein
LETLSISVMLFCDPSQRFSEYCTLLNRLVSCGVLNLLGFYCLYLKKGAVDEDTFS